MDKYIIEKLYKTWSTLIAKDNAIRKMFDPDLYYLGEETLALQEVILTLIGVPEETYKDSGAGVFYRDWHHEQFYLCGDGKFTLEELKKLLADVANE